MTQDSESNPTKQLRKSSWCEEWKRTPGGAGRRPAGYSRDCETLKKKLDVINFFKANGDMQLTHAFFPTTASLKSDRKAGTATTLSATGEEGLVEWVNSLREDGVPVSRLMLQLQAQGLAVEEGVPPGIFEGKWSWQQGFLLRHGFPLRTKTRQGQKPPPAMEKEAREFWHEKQQIKRELGVSKIYNADQRGICFEYLPKQTVNKKGAKTIWVRCGGKDKERMTGMFLADSTGKQLLSQSTVYKSTGTVLVDGIPSFRTDDEPVLLIWDEFSAHWTDEVQEHAVLFNVHLVKVPARLTSVCQPADISWLRPLKQRLRKHWLKDHAASSSTRRFQLQPPSRGEAIAWATSAWKQLGISGITSGFSGQTKPYCPDDHENNIIEQLESLHVIEDTVSDSDDFLEHRIAGSSDEQ
ncbi:hypothetical protein PHMEG_0007615 [Phytophthora megakarya]|uniref:HTH CENPB-type domain-containing protein n=1 Tax=Phytophthora megakarya TaxID=4795 RepID=A0A225WKQ9_9STRA|nr:hypothetical protein PHMEG_0007615 [Phytophthora megakarya]